MHFEPDEIYHVFNRGNHKQLLFFNEKNYIYFLAKIKNDWTKYGDILCYCLIHFHFMVVAKAEGCTNIAIGDRTTHMQNFSKAIGNTLSAYTKAINSQNKTTGNLFQKKTQAKCLNNAGGNNLKYQNYSLTCFHYIHQNPLHANIVKNCKDWSYGSFRDYYGLRNGTLCNKKLAMELLGYSENDFKYPGIANLDDAVISTLF